MTNQKKFAVVSPEYGEVVPVLDYGEGPVEYGCDYIEIETNSRRDALVLGIKAMRKDLRQYRYLATLMDDECPFTGFKVYAEE